MSTLLSASTAAGGVWRDDASAAAETADEDDVIDAEADSRAVASAATRTRQWTDVPGASQTLLWGAAEADDAERAALIRRLGGRVDDDDDLVAKRNVADASRGGRGATGTAAPQRLTDAGFVGEGVGTRVGRRRAAAAAAAAAAAGGGERTSGW